MHYLFYVTKYIHVILTFASHLRDKQGNWGQSGVNVSKPAGYAVCDGNMSSFDFLRCGKINALKVLGRAFRRQGFDPMSNEQGNICSVSGPSLGTTSFLMSICCSTMLVKLVHVVLYSPLFLVGICARGNTIANLLWVTT